MRQHNKQLFVWMTLFMLIGAFLLSACTSNAESTALPTLAVMETEEPASEVTEVITEESEEAEAPSATEEPTEEPTEDVTAVVTEEVADTAITTEEPTFNLDNSQTSASDAMQVVAEYDFKNEDDTLILSIHSVGNGEGIDNLPDLEEGAYWVVVTATLLNFTGEAIEITEDSISLLDTSDNVYEPVAAGEAFRTGLIGTELSGTGTYMGSALFSLPEDETPFLFQWCPEENCTSPLQSPLPETTLR